MSAAVELVETSPAGSSRLLADLEEFEGRGRDGREPVYDRLEAALGRDFAERIVAALSKEALDRLDVALTPAFARGLAVALEKDRGDVVDNAFGKVYAIHFPDGNVARWTTSGTPKRTGEVVTLNGERWQIAEVVEVDAGGVDYKLRVEPLAK